MDTTQLIGDILTRTMFAVGGVSIPLWGIVAVGVALLIIMASTGRERTGDKDDPTDGFGDWNDDGA